jgi:hypothetical protein
MTKKKTENKKYIVQIIRARVIEVEAQDEEQAFEKAQDIDYNDNSLDEYNYYDMIILENDEEEKNK